MSLASPVQLRPPPVVPWLTAPSPGWGGRQELEQHLSRLSATEFACLVCQYRGAQKHHVLNHIEAKHMKVSQHNCDICGKECPTRNAMYAHKSRTHK